jgi:opacity protein-like surface antigen
MKRTLALAGVAALLVACAGMSDPDAAAIDGPGAAVAASLGYHGPLHRANIQYGN